MDTTASSSSLHTAMCYVMRFHRLCVRENYRHSIDITAAVNRTFYSYYILAKCMRIEIYICESKRKILIKRAT